MQIALGRPFHDATSGLYAADAKALPILAQPYTSGAPEVEAILRLDPKRACASTRSRSNMRERAVGESKLRGKKALMLVITVIGTLLGGASPAPWPLTRRRVVAVLGYSRRGDSVIHDICLQRLRRAEDISQPTDAVVLLGAGRARGGSEAALMAAGLARGHPCRRARDRVQVDGRQRPRDRPLRRGRRSATKWS